MNHIVEAPVNRLAVGRLQKAEDFHALGWRDAGDYERRRFCHRQSA
jgi:hypothetical protein